MAEMGEMGIFRQLSRQRFTVHWVAYAGHGFSKGLVLTSATEFGALQRSDAFAFGLRNSPAPLSGDVLNEGLMRERVWVELFSVSCFWFWCARRKHGRRTRCRAAPQSSASLHQEICQWADP